MNNLKDSFDLETLQSIMKLCNAVLLISMIENHHCGLWERSIVEEDTQLRFGLVMVVFWVFFVIIYKVMLKPFELNSANVDLKHDAFKLMSEA